MILAFASSKCPLLKTGSNFFIAIWDISVAFMHATIDELIFVHPPKDLVPPGFCWRWADTVTEVLVSSDYIASKVFAMVFLHRTRGSS